MSLTFTGTPPLPLRSSLFYPLLIDRMTCAVLLVNSVRGVTQGVEGARAGSMSDILAKRQLERTNAVIATLESRKINLQDPK